MIHAWMTTAAVLLVPLHAGTFLHEIILSHVTRYDYWPPAAPDEGNPGDQKA
jgi:hypothetical protein